MHMITAFICVGAPGREFWLTAIMTPRFLVSAFAAGPILLITLVTFIEKATGCSLGEKAIQKLINVALYMLILDLFFIGLELFTAFYSHIPAHTVTSRYLLFGLDGGDALRPWYWAMFLTTLATVILFSISGIRKRRSRLVTSCVIGIIGLWIDKGFVLVVAAFNPNPFGQVKEYPPTLPETFIAIGIYGVGALVITVLYKIAVSIEKMRRRSLSLNAEIAQRPRFPQSTNLSWSPREKGPIESRVDGCINTGFTRLFRRSVDLNTIISARKIIVVFKEKKSMKKNHMRMFIGLIGIPLALAFLPAPAMAATMSEDVLAGLMINQGEMNGVHFMSGGVGVEERVAMRQMARKYNTKLVFATRTGCYLADVKLSISEAGGKPLLDLTANGPWVYAKLPDGEYHVTAVVEGEKKVQKFAVGSGFQTLMFTWKTKCDRAK